MRRADRFAPERCLLKGNFDLRRWAHYDSVFLGAAVRQFFYGIILGAAAMYCYERFDPPRVLAYLNSATQSAVQSTHGYAGPKH